MDSKGVPRPGRGVAVGGGIGVDVTMDSGVEAKIVMLVAVKESSSEVIKEEAGSDPAGVIDSVWIDGSVSTAERT